MRIAFILSLASLSAAAQPSWRAEIQLSAWRVATTGQIQSGLLPIDLQSDLALQDRTVFFGRLTFRPGHRHRVLVEGTPLSFEGRNELRRTVVYNGRTYNVNDTISSEAALAYAFGGYQYEIVSAERGHVGLGGGAAYVDASGEIRSVATGISAGRAHRIGLPLAHIDGAIFLLPGSRVVEVGGDLKGMSFGRYGRFVQGTFTGRLNVGRVGVHAGYSFIDADIHEGAVASESRAGVATRIRGPMLGLHFRL
jgi:hypothetical protein